MCFKCSSTVAVAKLSTAYTSRRPSATTTHATPTSYLELCSRRLPLAARPQAHGNVFDKSWTRAAATPQRDGRERRGHVHMRPSCTSHKLAVWPRRSQWSSSTATRSGGRPIVEKESARGGGHQGQRGGSRRSARRSSHLVILLTNVYALTALLCTFTTLYFYNFSPTFANGNSTTSSSVSDPRLVLRPRVLLLGTCLSADGSVLVGVTNIAAVPLPHLGTVSPA